MSLVVSYTIHNSPCLLGDILISQEGAFKSSIVVPSIPKIEVIVPKNYNKTIVGYRQKIICLKDDVCIGWAGSIQSAIEVCSTLHKELPILGTDEITLKTILESFTFDKEQQLHLLIWKTFGKAECFFWDSEANDELNLVNCPYAIGSGKNHAEAMFKAKSVETNKGYITMVLAKACETFSFELSYGLNLKDMWGGSIQIVVYQNNRFEYFTDYLSFHFHVIEEENKNLQVFLHPYFFQPIMLKNYLILKRMNDMNEMNNVFVVPPLLESTERILPIDIPPQSPIPGYFCMSGIFQHYKGGNSLFSFILPKREADEYMKIEIGSDGDATISFFENYLRRIINICKNIQSYDKEYI